MGHNKQARCTGTSRPCLRNKHPSMCRGGWSGVTPALLFPMGSHRRAHPPSFSSAQTQAVNFAVNSPTLQPSLVFAFYTDLSLLLLLTPSCSVPPLGAFRLECGAIRVCRQPGSGKTLAARFRKRSFFIPLKCFTARWACGGGKEREREVGREGAICQRGLSDMIVSVFRSSKESWGMPVRCTCLRE